VTFISTSSAGCAALALTNSCLSGQLYRTLKNIFPFTSEGDNLGRRSPRSFVDCYKERVMAAMNNERASDQLAATVALTNPHG